MNKLSATSIRFWAIAIGFYIFWPVDSSAEVEIKKKGNFLKIYLARQLDSNQAFDSAGMRKRFDDQGHGAFEQTVIEYRYGMTNRLNIGCRLPVVENSFTNRYGSSTERGVSDFVGLAEYRFLTLPWVLSLRGEGFIPLQYNSAPSLWIGNGAYGLLGALGVKRFFLESGFSRLFLDADVGYRAAIHEMISKAGQTANLDGKWALPYRGSANLRPIQSLTILAGVVGSHSQERSYWGAQGGVKYRFGRYVELEAIGTNIMRGRNSTSAVSLLFGITINTNRLWY